MSAFAAYLLGALLVVAGLAFGAYLLNVPPAWIGVGVIVAIGIGIMLATTRTRPPAGRYPGDRYPHDRYPGDRTP